MTKLISFILLTVLVTFGSTVALKLYDYKKYGVTDIQIDFKEGSICGKQIKRQIQIHVCDSLYVLNVN